jgi:hypothetical protein
MRDFVRKLVFSTLAIRLSYCRAKQFGLLTIDTEIILRARIIERKARRKWVQRLLQQ